MTTPAIIYLFILGIDLLLNAYQHGKPRTNTNFWTSLLATIISVGLLYWGGFFN